MDFHIPAEYLGAAAAVVDQEYAVEAAEQKYPYVQWVEAGQNMAFPSGGFFLNIEQPALADVAWGGSPVQITVGTSKHIVGFPLNPVRFMFLARRTDWGVDPNNGEPMIMVGDRDVANQLASMYAMRAKSKFRALVLMEGMEAIGPMMLTLTATKGMAMNQAIDEFLNRVWKPYDAQMKQAGAAGGPPFGVLCAIQAGEKRAASKQQGKGALITPPMWIEPASITEVLVPFQSEAFAIGVKYWKEAQEWASAPFLMSSKAQQMLAGVPVQAPQPAYAPQPQPPAYQQPVQRPMFQQPAVQQPVYAPQPAVQQPAVQQPIYQQPVPQPQHQVPAPSPVVGVAPQAPFPGAQPWANPNFS